MASIEKNIWDYLIKEINNPYGVAGLMGNIYAESGMIPNRVEVLCLNRLTRYVNIISFLWLRRICSPDARDISKDESFCLSKSFF